MVTWKEFVQMHRKTQRLAWLIALGLSLAPLASAAQEIKVAFVDREKALFSTDQGKRARDELQAKVKAAEGELKPLADRIQAVQKDLEAKKFVLAQDALRNMQAELLELQNRYQSKGKELEGQLKIDQARLLSPLEEKLKSVIEKMGQEQGYSMILERQVPQLILYSREQHDITDQVVARFNAAK
jgi:outer membrane protein